jgi:hypothetical protein
MDTYVSAETESAVRHSVKLLQSFALAKPVTKDWSNANKLFGHPRGCRCSTCELSAVLAARIRFMSE